MSLKKELLEAAFYYRDAKDPILRQQSDLCRRAADELSARSEKRVLVVDDGHVGQDMMRALLSEAQGKVVHVDPQWITCPATGQQCNDFCDPGKGDTCASSGLPFAVSAIGAPALKPWTEEDKSRLNLALFGKSDDPLAWVQADGTLLYKKELAAPGQAVHALYAKPTGKGPFSREEKLEEALRQCLYFEDGRWLGGLREDADVTYLVGDLLKEKP